MAVAMHMSDGLVNAPTPHAVFGLVAAIGLAISGEPGPLGPRRAHGPDGRARLGLRLRRPDDQLSDPARRQRPPARRRAGRHPGRAVGSGRCASRSCWSCRRLLFADGGLTALGTNITNMALVRVRSPASRWRTGAAPVRTRSRGALAHRVVRRGAGQHGRRSLSRSCSSTPSAGRAVPDSARSSRLMVGLHVLVGIGEGIITAATVGAVAAVRPDLVYLLRGTRPAVTLRTLARPPDECPSVPVPAWASSSRLWSSPAGCRTSPARSPGRARLGGPARLQDRQRDGRRRPARRTTCIAQERHRGSHTAGSPLADYRRRRPRGHHRARRDRRRAGDGARRGRLLFRLLGRRATGAAAGSSPRRR